MSVQETQTRGQRVQAATAQIKDTEKQITSLWQRHSEISQLIADTVALQSRFSSNCSVITSTCDRLSRFEQEIKSIKGYQARMRSALRGKTVKSSQEAIEHGLSCARQKLAYIEAQIHACRSLLLQQQAGLQNLSPDC